MLLKDVLQSCHSGSALDLPYIYSTEGKVKEPNLQLEAGKGALGIAKAYLAKDKQGMIAGASSLFQVVSGQNSKAIQKTKQTRTSAADVVSSISILRATGCLWCHIDFMERLQG
jgi:hypothetical protein